MLSAPLVPARSSANSLPRAAWRRHLGAACSAGRWMPAFTAVAANTSFSQPHRLQAWSIREAGASDADKLAQLDLSCSSDGSAGWSAATFSNTMQQSGATVLVAHEAARAERRTEATAASDGSAAGAILGFVAGLVVADELQIENLAVAKAARGQALGMLLMQAIMQRSGVAAGGCQSCSQDQPAFTVEPPPQRACFLEVKEGNDAALGLYAKLGFKAVGRRKNFYADGAAAIVMVCGTLGES